MSDKIREEAKEQAKINHKNLGSLKKKQLYHILKIK